MATISHNDLAPADEEVTYSLGNADPFTLSGADATYEVEEPGDDADEAERLTYHALIANAQAHPWLRVDVPVPDASDEPAPLEVEYPKTAIDAGLDQNEVVVVDEDAEVPIAETLAADEAQGDEPIVTNEPDPDEPDAPAEGKE